MGKGRKHGQHRCNEHAWLLFHNWKWRGKDEEKAVKLWQTAADLNNTSAMVRLGACFIHGIQVQQDKHHGIHLWEKAAFLGSKEAIELLGVCYSEDGHLINKTQTGVLNQFPMTEEWSTLWIVQDMRQIDFIAEKTFKNRICCNGLNTHPEDFPIFSKMDTLT